MADRVPINFRKSPEAITTFPFSDISEGTGTVLFFGAVNKASGSALVPFLSTFATYSNSISSSTQVAAGGTFSLVEDDDFDVLFNLSKRIKGKLRVTLTMGKASAGTTNDTEQYARILVRKWDGTTETEIAQQDSELIDFAQTGADTPLSETVNIEVDIATTQNFSAGETLRVTVQIWGMVTGSNATNIGYAHDPKDRNDDDETVKIIEDVHTTVMEVHVPFLLNL